VPTWKPELAAVPPTIRAALARLQSRGRAWLVGGTVRDLLLGLSPTDYDVATDLTPEEIQALLPGADLRDAKLGAVRVPGLEAPVVATTLRGEADYRDHRHPARVLFVDDPAVDARRRDFTVNALYADPVA
jgi:tRNA nucleotidyltransferase/poly(A) polymerase